MRRVSAALLLAAALALLALCHFHAHVVYTGGLDTAHTLDPPAGAPVPTPPPPREAGRVYVIIVDGLRADGIAAMPALRRLGARGAVRTLRAELPSYTFASITTLATGVAPRWSGVRLNGGHTHHPYDTLVAAAARAGVPSLVAARWRGLGRVLDWRLGPSLPASDPAALPPLPRRALVWMHFNDVDEAGHAHGGRSRAYVAAAARVDAELAPIFAAVDLSRDAVVVLSDHGHLDRGGHGGSEPAAVDGILVVAGRGLRSDGARLAPARLRDTCATVAALAGVPPPADDLGLPLVDLFAGDAAAHARLLAPAWTVRRVAAARLDAVLGVPPPPAARAARLAARLADGDGSAVAPTLALAAADDATRAARYAADLAARRRRQLARAALVALALVAAWLAPPAWRPRVVDLRPALAYVALFGAGYLALGYRFSWSLPRGEAHFVVETGLLGLAAAAAAFVVGRARRFGGSPARALPRAAVVLPLFAGYALAAAVSGSDPAWLAGPRASFALPLYADAAFYLALACAVDAAAALAARKPCAPDPSARNRGARAAATPARSRWRAPCNHASS